MAGESPAWWALEMCTNQFCGSTSVKLWTARITGPTAVLLKALGLVRRAAPAADG